MKKTSSDDANAMVCCYPSRAYFEKWPSSEDNTLFVRAKRRKNKGARRKKKEGRRKEKGEGGKKEGRQIEKLGKKGDERRENWAFFFP